ncbi:hypothetical protein OLK001_31960 [Synechocystis sp. LKSZ1]
MTLLKVYTRPIQSVQHSTTVSHSAQARRENPTPRSGKPHPSPWKWPPKIKGVVAYVKFYATH